MLTLYEQLQMSRSNIYSLPFTNSIAVAPIYMELTVIVAVTYLPSVMRERSDIPAAEIQ